MARSNSTRKYREKTSFGTVYDPKPERKDADMYFLATEGDRCDNLAFRFYGDPHLWVVIARANSLKTMNIPAGTHLRIPTLS